MVWCNYVVVILVFVSLVCFTNLHSLSAAA